jgi:hypothetical protein
VISSENTFFYEFNIEDIAFAEELPNISPNKFSIASGNKKIQLLYVVIE